MWRNRTGCQGAAEKNNWEAALFWGHVLNAPTPLVFLKYFLLRFWQLAFGTCGRFVASAGVQIPKTPTKLFNKVHVESFIQKIQCPFFPKILCIALEHQLQEHQLQRHNGTGHISTLCATPWWPCPGLVLASSGACRGGIF
jgi:hypothetical protein